MSDDGEENYGSTPEQQLDTSQEEWQPRADFLSALLEMGISADAARRGLYHTENASVDAAAAYIFEQPASVVNQPFDPELTDESDEREYKMVFIVNVGLGMGVGKIAAQVGHAAINLHRLMLGSEKFAESAEDWEESGEKKIVLQVSTTEDLLSLYSKASDLELLTWLVEDAGHTQVPEGSRTVLGLFGEDILVNQVTGSLKLL